MKMKISQFYRPLKQKEVSLPLFISRIKAGFPSPADDYIEKNLDLNEYLISNPSATFFVRVEGDSMKNAGIYSGDILIVDRSLEVRDRLIVIAALNSELTVKRIKIENDRLYLCPENESYSPLLITAETDFEIWGIVTYCIHKV